MSGWVKLWRKTLGSNMYRSLSSKQRDVMITLLMMANHEENEWEWNGQVFKAEPGQVVTSLEKIAENCASDVKVQSVRTALLKLEKWGFLTNQSTKTGRLITIVNWGTYQAKQDETNKETNKELTKLQQSSNKELTTNKKSKKDKNDKKNTYAEFVTLTPAEYQRLVDEHGERDTARLIEMLNNYKGASGKTYKSDYLAILNWVVKRLAEEKAKEGKRSDQYADLF